MNPMQMLKMLRGKMSPQQMAMNMIKNNSNPIFSNLIEKAQNGDNKAVEEFARNYCKENNRDFDKEMKEFMSNFQ